MYNSIHILHSSHRPSLDRYRPLRQVGLRLSAACLCSLSIGLWPQQAFADESVAPDSTQVAPSTAAPAVLIDKLAEVDSVANQQDLSTLMGFYSPDFISGDGLNRKALQQVITAFWQDYQDLSYATELVAWEKNAQGYVVETKTTITGTQTLDQGAVKLQSTLHSRQHWVGDQITKQDILAERSQLTSGQKPPKVQVNLPAEVGVGEKFEFDVIVDEPLGNNPLLGLAIEEPITINNYLKQPQLKLELLPAGGLFKVGTAAKKPTSEWVSAVLVQDGGITIVSQRLNVVLQKKQVGQSRK